jgi:uncharacterized membrane protein
MTTVFAQLGPSAAGQGELWANPVTGLIVSLSLIISGIGVAVIAWGAYSSVLRLIGSETAAARGQMPRADAVMGRLVFSTYLLPGLDFLTAGSLVKTLVAPDWHQAVLLACLVFARTLLALGLRWGVTPLAALASLPPVAEQLAAPQDPAETLQATAENQAPVAAPAAQ